VSHDSDVPAAPVTADDAPTAGADTTMNIRFTAVRDREYLRRLVRESVRGSTWSGRLYLLGLLVISVLCFVSGDGRAVLAGLLSMSLCALSWQQMSFPARRILRRLPPYAFEPHEIVITDSGLAITSAVAATRMAWATFTRAQERPYAFVLFGHGETYRDVPRSPLTSQQDEQLRRLLIDRGLLPRPTNDG
jgi:hypothetical protein